MSSCNSYYQAYLALFSASLTEKPDSIKSVLEKYVFSKDANLVPGKKGELPSMLCRFLGGLLHPLIHAAYGAEFSIPGLVAEGANMVRRIPARNLTIPYSSRYRASSVAPGGPHTNIPRQPVP